MAQPSRRWGPSRLRSLRSRLKGYLNVLGPNPSGGVLHDPFYVLRRAVLLRSMLGDYEGIMKDGVPQIDPGLLNAFLHTRTYRHGARSMESIIACSRLSGRNKFERSSLPPEDQLELHVEARDFIGKLSKLKFTGELLERMARAAHEASETGGGFADDDRSMRRRWWPYLPMQVQLKGHSGARHQFRPDNGQLGHNPCPKLPNSWLVGLPEKFLLVLKWMVSQFYNKNC